MSQTVKVWVLVLIGVCLAGSACLAEAVGGDPMEFSIFLKGVYTDNRDATEFNEEDNYDLIATPRLDVFADWERTILDFYYAPSFRYRSDPAPNQDDAEWYQAGGVNLDHRVTPRLKLKLHDQIDYSEDPGVEDGGSRIGPERLFLLNQADATVIAEITRQSLFEVYGRNRMKRYDDNEVADRLDEDRTDVGAKLWHRLQRTQAVYMEGRASMFGYESFVPEGADVAIQRDFDLLYAGVGVENVFNQNLRGALVVGWQWQDYDDEGLDAQDALYAQGTLRGTLTPATRLTAEVTHAIRDADAFPFASQEYTEYFAKVEWDATAAVTLGVWGKIRSGDYDDTRPMSAAGIADVVQGGDEDAVVAAVEAGYKLDEDTAIRLVQHYEDVSSDVPGIVNFTRNTTSLILSRHF